MGNTGWRPRLSLEISEDLYKKFQDLVPWGLRTQLVTTLLDGALEMIEKEGDIVTALIISKRLHTRDILKITTSLGNTSAEKGGKDGND